MPSSIALILLLFPGLVVDGSLLINGVTVTLNSSSDYYFKMAIVLTTGSAQPYDYYNMAPAIQLGIERSYRTYGVYFEPFLAVYNGNCDEIQALAQAVRAVNSTVDLLLGPGCTDDLIVVGKLTTSYKIPVMSGGGNLLDSTEPWPYVTRTGYNTKTQWTFFGLICDQYNWTTAFVAYETDVVNTYYSTSAESLIRYMRNNKMLPYDYPFKTTDAFGYHVADTLLNTAMLQARVIVLLMNAGKTRQVMIQAQRHGMCNGDYMFMAVDILKTDLLDPSGMQNDIYDQEAPLAYRALLVLALRHDRNDPQFKAFEEQVRLRATPQAGGRPLDVNYYSHTFHDAIMIYAWVMNQTLADGIAIIPENALDIQKRFNDQRFNVTGKEVDLVTGTVMGSVGVIYMDENGDRTEDYQLYQMRPFLTENGEQSQKFGVIGEFFGYRGKYEEVRPIKWLSPNGTPVVNRPTCGYDGNDPVCVSEARTVLGAALGGVFLFIFLATFGGLGIARYVQWRREINNLDWLAAWGEIFIHQRSNSIRSVSSANNSFHAPNPDTGPQAIAPGTQGFMLSMKSNNPTMKSQSSVQKSAMTRESIMKTSTLVATFRNSLTILRPCDGVHIELSSQVRWEVRVIKAFTCETLLKFVAACIEPEHVLVLGEYCSRGTLQDVLQNDAVTLDWVFRLSFINDIVGALIYLHASVVVFHGRLTSKTCFVDKRFLLKVGDYGLPSFYNKPVSVASEYEINDLLWTAPEILRSSKGGLYRGSQEGDAFAFAIILQEIILRESPYFANGISSEEILKKVERGERPPFRPIVQDAFTNQEIMFVMRSCWAENPSERLKLTQVRSCLRQLAKSNTIEKTNIIDTLIERMEQYAQNLETSVDEKTQALTEEKKKTDQLLYSILPKPIAEQLKRGEPVLPELYDSVTIYFGDIVEFTTLSATSSPTEIVNLMNDLYCQFDQIIAKFDAYKVETIGDCYVIVSGLPNRNGQKHAGEIARLALTLRSSMTTFKVPHMPHKQLQLRIGLNSGVVGFATPRYCLFGDTVNVASRMESTGDAMKIQITQTTETILRYLGTFYIEMRGDVQIKGKGPMNTFWLIGEAGRKPSGPPAFDNSMPPPEQTAPAPAPIANGI